MSRQVEHDCDLRWGRFIRLVLVVLFAAWSLASVLHTPAVAAALHCHHLYHMAAGMMTNVVYES